VAARRRVRSRVRSRVRRSASEAEAVDTDDLWLGMGDETRINVENWISPTDDDDE
jgi:hypothetical protein